MQSSQDTNEGHGDGEAVVSNARRSQRQRHSTTIQIDGHTVLKNNNYLVKGLKYEYGAYEADGDPGIRTTKKASKGTVDNGNLNESDRDSSPNDRKKPGSEKISSDKDNGENDASECLSPSAVDLASSPSCNMDGKQAPNLPKRKRRERVVSPRKASKQIISDDLDFVGSSSDEGSDSWSEESSEEDEPLLDVNDDDDSSSPKRDKRKRSRMVSNDQSSSTGGSARTKGPSTKTKSQWELQRVEHNESVKARIEDKRAFRTNFLTQNLKVMEPFMDEATLQKWSGKENQSISTADSEDPKSGTEETPAPAPLPASFSSVQFKLREIHIQPELVEGGEMRDYQMLGLQFLVNMYRQNLGMILGDEMGLGKTLQTISLFCYLKENMGVTGPSLVICPLTVLKSWCDEIKKWAPKLKFHSVHSSDASEQENQRKILAERGPQFDVILTTYEMSKAPQLTRAWARLHFNILVLDEGHKIKNHETQISDAARKIHCETRLLLTGTPLQNNLVELWSLLNFLYPDIFLTSEPFADAFNIGGNKIDKLKLSQAQKLLDVFMIRRLKVQVERLMPKKIETKVYCPLSNTQLFWYKALLMKDWSGLERVNERDGTGREPAKSHKKLLENLMMQLRKCCLHPFLFDGAEADIDKTTCEELVGASGKLSVLDMLLRDLFQKGHRCVLFSQFTSMLNILEDYCRMRDWKYCKLDGATARAKRGFLVEQFNASPSPFFIFLMSTRSGGMGLNLQSADTCILFDSDWNPQMDLQAMARVHRIGQEKTVHVYRLVSGGTVEEKIVERAEKKLLLDQMVNRSNANSVRLEEDTKTGGLSAKELFADIKFGSHAVFGDSSQNELPSDDDIACITDRNRTESDSKGRLKGNEAKDVEGFDPNKNTLSTQKFAGIDFRKIRQERAQQQEDNIPENLAGIAHLWQSISQLKKRQVKKRIILVNAEGSDYEDDVVPVLAVNKDDMEREQKGRQVAKTVKKFDHSDYCQDCGDGGLLILCPRCPVALHAECIGVQDPKHFKCCPHHRCYTCNKSTQQAGGMLFPCAICTTSFCEECLPRDSPGLRFLGECTRFQKLGYNTSKLFAYIHCSQECEEYAISEFGWEPSMLVQEQSLPPPMDVSANFGGTGDEVTFDTPRESEEQLGRQARCKVKKSYVDSFEDEAIDSDEENIVKSSMQGNGGESGASGGGAPSQKTKPVQNAESSSGSDSSVSSADVLSEESEDEIPLEMEYPKKKTEPKAVTRAPTLAKNTQPPMDRQEWGQQNNSTPSQFHHQSSHAQNGYMPHSSAYPYGHSSAYPYGVPPGHLGYSRQPGHPNGFNTMHPAGPFAANPSSQPGVSTSASAGPGPIQTGAPYAPPSSNAGFHGNGPPMPFHQQPQHPATSNGFTTINVQVPHGLPPGQRYFVITTPHGYPMNVALPPGVTGGAVIPVRIPIGTSSSTATRGWN